MIAGCKYGNVVNLMSILTLILKAFDARVRNIWVRTGRRKSRDSPARPLLERGSARSQVGVGKRGDLGLHGVDARHGVRVLLPRRLPVVAATAA